MGIYDMIKKKINKNVFIDSNKSKTEYEYFVELNDIYNNRLITIFQEGTLNKKEQLEKLKSDICFGYNNKFNKYKDLFLKDLEEKFEEIDKYICDEDYNKMFKEIISIQSANSDIEDSSTRNDDDEMDPRLKEAIELVLKYREASASFIQRKMQVGYARARKDNGPNGRKRNNFWISRK